ncbi:5'-methylthioadenosine/S-adenosylhomocysteine nucleosidase [Pelagibacterium montanilacus]|uniref:5'-methylthioadenosine/S-adenosylhomocysteine nucleosidase n=1 Tax=Pelagibacterium montanilacus TaxID=2185280 RepID=UPI000F8D1A97|nr:5'-methylthioadenosine/S-adenosylhomocysteine nucleosidase [Pelagibacterium montanilacus]
MEFSSSPILYVMAADQEYGPALRARITPLMTGVGPVEAAIALTRALDTAASKGTRPRYVVSLGSAGSARLEQTGVYQAVSVCYRDIDASPLGFAKGVVPFLDQPATLELGPRVPGLPAATLSTGGNIISGAVYETIAEDMVDMETYAIARVCQTFEVGLIAIRGISDGAAELSVIEDWTRYLDVIDAKLAAAVDTIEAFVSRQTA